MNNHSMNKVFISYSRDSASHENFVLSLSAKLREDGIPTMLDKYVPYPDEGWTMWTEAQVRESNFVLLICTPTYLLRFREKETTYWINLLFEGALITQLKKYEHDSDIDQYDKPLTYMQRSSDLESNLALLNKKKSKLEEQKIIETHAAVKFNLEYLISEVDEECKKIEMEISHLDQRMKNISVLGNNSVSTDFYFDEKNQTRIICLLPDGESEDSIPHALRYYPKMHIFSEYKKLYATLSSKPEEPNIGF